MAITFLRRSGENKTGLTILRKGKVDPDAGLQRMRYRGELLNRAIQFPEDVALMKSQMRGMGWFVSEKDCQALWDRLSREYYPYENPGDYAWLTAGIMLQIMRDHAQDFLVQDDASHSVR